MFALPLQSRLNRRSARPYGRVKGRVGLGIIQMLKKDDVKER